jgi:hypothetical protein
MENKIRELGNDPLCLLEIDEFAYDELPQSYKEDHSLNFFVDVNGNLCAEHTLHDEEYVWAKGEWERIV